MVVKKATKSYPIPPAPAATLVGPPALPRAPARSKPLPIPTPALKKRLPPAAPGVVRAPSMRARHAATNSPRVTYAVS